MCIRDRYLFKDGSIIGLNDKLLQRYVEWTANRRLKSIGLKPIFDVPISNNPLPWTQHWLSSKGMQVAPQETEVESYLIGSIKQDVKKDTFAGFKLYLWIFGKIIKQLLLRFFQI